MCGDAGGVLFRAGSDGSVTFWQVDGACAFGPKLGGSLRMTLEENGDEEPPAMPVSGVLLHLDPYHRLVGKAAVVNEHGGKRTSCTP